MHEPTVHRIQRHVEMTHVVFFMSRIYGSPLMKVALGPTSARMVPNEGRLLTFLRHPGRKASLVLSLRSQGNADHPESTSNHVSKSSTVSLGTRKLQMTLGPTW